MRIINSKSFVQKIVISLIFIILVNFIIPNRVHATEEDSDVTDVIFQPVMQMIALLGDVAFGIVQYYMVGTDNMVSDVMLDATDANVQNGYLTANNVSEPDERVSNGKYDGKIFGGEEVEVPNILYSPEYIFANKIAILDANFVNPGTYKGTNKTDGNGSSQIINSLKSTVSKWYKGFRNLAIVVLLSILIYIGIRILIGSTAQDKAKYQERLKDWLVGLCLVFAMHYIMAGIMLLSESFTNLLNAGIDTEFYIQFDSGFSEPDSLAGKTVKTNLMGYIRFKAQAQDLMDAAAYTLMYIVLVLFTYRFTITYIKRLLYVAFFTMISPLVAMTYPLDKLKDGKAQAFSIWFKEFFMNAIIQPVHLILYYVLISSAVELAKNNILYSLVALGFMIPAEKFIKKMFGLESETAGTLGKIAGGALAMKGLQSLASGASSIVGKANSGNKSAGPKVEDKEKTSIRMNEASSDTKDLNAWKNNDGNLNVANDNFNNIGEGAVKAGAGAGAMAAGAEMANFGSNPGGNARYESPLNLPGSNYGGLNANPYINRVRSTPVGPLKSTKPTAKTRITNIGKRALKNGWKVAKKGAKYTGRKLPRFLGRTAGAMIGIGAGIMSGDFSNVATYGAAGFMAGGQIGTSISNMGSNLIEKGKELPNQIRTATGNLANAYNEDVYGLEYAEKIQQQKQNERAKKEYLKDEAKIREAKKIAAKVGSNDYRNIQEKMFDYEAAGITDNKEISTGIKMEHNHNELSHEQVINVMQEAKNINEDKLLDDKKRINIEKNLEAKAPGNGARIVDLIGEAKGMGEYMKQIRAAQNNVKSQVKPKNSGKSKVKPQLKSTNSNTGRKTKK